MHSKVFLSTAIGAAVSFASASFASVAHAQDQSSTSQGLDPEAMQGLANIRMHEPAEDVFREWISADRQWSNQTAWQKGRDAGYEIQPDTVGKTIGCVLGAKAGIAHSIEQADAQAQKEWQKTYDIFEFLVYSHMGARGDPFELAEERITKKVPARYESLLSRDWTLDRMQAASAHCPVVGRVLWRMYFAPLKN